MKIALILIYSSFAPCRMDKGLLPSRLLLFILIGYSHISISHQMINWEAISKSSEPQSISNFFDTFYLNNVSKEKKQIKYSTRFGLDIFSLSWKMTPTNQLFSSIVYNLGVKIQNLKLNFKTGGTWRQVGQ